MYGDSFLPINFQDVQSFFLQNSCLALMTVMNNANKWDKSNVVLKQNNLIFYDKFNTDLEMNFIDYGLSLLSKKVLFFYKFNKKFDLSKFYNSLSIDKFLHGYIVKKRFYEIGSIIGLDETRKFLKIILDNSNIIKFFLLEKSYTKSHLDETVQIIKKIEDQIEKIADVLLNTKVQGGRIFFLGVGGSAGNASHAVNDFRKIVGIESYAPTDNVSELTARTNDEGWDSIFSEWLKVSKLNSKDCIFIFSVGGGNLEKNISPNLVKAFVSKNSVALSELLAGMVATQRKLQPHVLLFRQ